MKKHEFYKKYSNVSIAERHIVGIGTIENGFKDSKSSAEIYSEMVHLDEVISRSKVRQEELLEIASNLFNQNV